MHLWHGTPAIFDVPLYPLWLTTNFFDAVMFAKLKLGNDHERLRDIRVLRVHVPDGDLEQMARISDNTTHYLAKAGCVLYTTFWKGILLNLDPTQKAIVRSVDITDMTPMVKKLTST